MNIDLIALLAIVSLSVALIAALVAYVRMQRKLERFQEEEDAIKAKARQKAKAILDNAQEAAFQIANESVLTAEENRQEIKAKLGEVVGRQLKEYQKMVHGASGNIEAEVAKTIELKMDTAFKEAQVEIASYKKQRAAEIDNQAKQAVKQFSREVLGKSLDLAQHEDLVIQALEKAKREYGF